MCLSTFTSVLLVHTLHLLGGGRVNKSKCKASCNATADHHEYLGYIGAIVAIVFFGSNFVPVKKYDTGDGKGSRKRRMTSAPFLSMLQILLAC